MKTKYQLKIEIRYSEEVTIEGEKERTCKKKIFHSGTFDTQENCIDYGNSIILDNLWMEQYPGYVGARLNNRFGYPLVRFGLKDRTEIFISVRKLGIMDTEEINKELRAFRGQDEN